MPKTLKDLLQLGNPSLYGVCEPVQQSELHMVSTWVADLHNVMQEIRTTYNFGRAIAAPQIGVLKRLVYVNIDKPIIIINPDFTYKSNEMIELWDDCMSFPNLLVRLRRHKSVTIQYFDENWQRQQWSVSNDLSELLQHECDHLDGILSTMRAIDSKSFKWRHF